MKEALLAAAEAMAQASLCLKTAADKSGDSAIDVGSLDENTLNAISSLVLKQRDNDIADLKEKVKELEDIPGNIESLESEIFDINQKYSHLEDLDADDFEGVGDRFDSLESSVSDLSDDKIDESDADRLVDQAKEELREEFEMAVEMTSSLAKHFAPT